MEIFSEKAEKYIANIEICFNNYNELVIKANTVANVCTRADWCLKACEFIEKAQNYYLKYTKPNKPISKEIRKFDYTLSQYANRVFIILENAIIPKLKTLDTNTKYGELYGQLSDIYYSLTLITRKMMYIAARWICERHINAWEYDLEEKDKILPPRLPLQISAMALFDRILAVRMGIKFDDCLAHLNKLVLCMPPSVAKTYDANIITNQMNTLQLIYYGITGIIRVTNTGDNARNAGSQCIGMVKNSVEYDDIRGEEHKEYPFLEIYPELKKNIKKTEFTNTIIDYKTSDLFIRDSTEKILFKGCRNGITDSIFMFGMDAGINGKRTKLGVICDDLSKGQKEADNDELHKEYTAIVRGELLDRNDREDNFMIIMGTMYNENDPQNSYINQWERQGLLKHPYLKDVTYTEDGKNAVCLVDIEDENGNSRAPAFRSNEFLKEKRDEFAKLGQSHIYNLMYRQKTDSREPKTFAYEFLQTYDKLPKTLCEESLTMIDTTRKSGGDYFANPYLKYCPENKLYYLTDVIFQQKSLGSDYDPKNAFAKEVCRKLIKNNTIECCVESNTSNTSTSLLQEICKQMKYTSCKFKNYYTVGKKGSTKITRILEHEDSIKNNIVFPSQKAINNNEMFQFMKIFTNWNSKSGQNKKNPDDAPDVIALFDDNFIHKKSSYGKAIHIPEEWQNKMLRY